MLTDCGRAAPVLRAGWSALALGSIYEESWAGSRKDIPTSPRSGQKHRSGFKAPHGHLLALQSCQVI